MFSVVVEYRFNFDKWDQIVYGAKVYYYENCRLFIYSKISCVSFLKLNFKILIEPRHNLYNVIRIYNIYDE